MRLRTAAYLAGGLLFVNVAVGAIGGLTLLILSRDDPAPLVQADPLPWKVRPDPGPPHRAPDGKVWLLG
jgi:hypothetical protein